MVRPDTFRVSTGSKCDRCLRSGGRHYPWCPFNGEPADPVYKPDHYARLNPEPVEVIQAWGLNFNLGNVIKYVARAGHKGAQTYGDDLAKAKAYLEREMARTDPGRSTK